MSVFYKFIDVYSVNAGRQKKNVDEFCLCVKKAAQVKGPKFILAYIYSPHPPFFVFGPRGEDFDLFKIASYAPKKLYAYQIAYLNRKLEQLIEAIILNSKKTPIIILQGDHGCAIGEFSVTRLDKRWLSQRMHILNTYLLPGGGQKCLYPDVTPVNTFRIILNYYFGQKYSILDDRSWYSSYRDIGENFIDVTDKIEY